MLLTEEESQTRDRFVLKRLHVSGGTEIPPTATVVLERDGVEHRMAGLGDGPVDAIYRTVSKITATNARLVSYSVKAITGGTDALGEVTVRIEGDGLLSIGQGADTDILVASAKAYLAALNRLERKKGKREDCRFPIPLTAKKRNSGNPLSHGSIPEPGLERMRMQTEKTRKKFFFSPVTG